MTRTRMMMVVAGCLLIFGSPALAGKSSLEMGERLFNDPALGGPANAKTCGSCHADGQGLQGVTDDRKLVKMMNRCVTDRLGGSRIDGRSAEMRSLKMYLRSLDHGS